MFITVIMVIMVFIFFSWYYTTKRNIIKVAIFLLIIKKKKKKVNILNFIKLYKIIKDNIYIFFFLIVFIIRTKKRPLSFMMLTEPASGSLTFYPIL